MKVLVTGYTGFLGSALVRELQGAGACLCLAGRMAVGSMARGVSYHLIRDLNRNTDWYPALEGVDSVVHLAARVHQFDIDNEAAYWEANVHGTIQLARQAAKAGVRRFVFLSTIKVNGDFTDAGFPFRAHDNAFPEGDYARSKYEAECRLLELASETGLEVAIIRPALVYGSGAKGNLLHLMNWIVSGRPLPFGAIENRRTLCSLRNLCSLIIICLSHPKAVNKIFLAGDGVSVSTPELIECIGNSLGRTPLLISVPSTVLRWSLVLVGRQEIWTRLGLSLELDIRENLKILGWTPAQSITDGIQEMASGFAASRLR